MLSLGIRIDMNIGFVEHKHVEMTCQGWHQQVQKTVLTFDYQIPQENIQINSGNALHPCVIQTIAPGNDKNHLRSTNMSTKSVSYRQDYFDGQKLWTNINK